MICEQRRLILLHADAERLQHHGLLDHLERLTGLLGLVHKLGNGHGIRHHSDRLVLLNRHEGRTNIDKSTDRASRA